jgi:hypothetical protein
MASRSSGRRAGTAIGSIFFTCASYLSFVEAANSPGTIEDRPVHHLRAASWRRPRSIDWWATAIQLIGTVYSTP